MSDLNRVLILGNFGSDPEVRYMSSGNAVCNFTLATNRTWKGKDGQQNQEVEWHKVVAYGRTAELVGEYMRKGSRLLVEGRLKTRKWEKDGATRWTTEVIAESAGFQRASLEAERQSSGRRPQAHKPQSQPQQQTMGGVPDGDFDDDIPF